MSRKRRKPITRYRSRMKKEMEKGAGFEEPASEIYSDWKGGRSGFDDFKNEVVDNNNKVDNWQEEDGQQGAGSPHKTGVHKKASMQNKVNRRFKPENQRGTDGQKETDGQIEIDDHFSTCSQQELDIPNEIGNQKRSDNRKESVYSRETNHNEGISRTQKASLIRDTNTNIGSKYRTDSKYRTSGKKEIGGKKRTGDHRRTENPIIFGKEDKSVRKDALQIVVAQADQLVQSSATEPEPEQEEKNPSVEAVHDGTHLMEHAVGRGIKRIKNRKKSKKKKPSSNKDSFGFAKSGSGKNFVSGKNFASEKNFTSGRNITSEKNFTSRNTFSSTRDFQTEHPFSHRIEKLSSNQKKKLYQKKLQKNRIRREYMRTWREKSMTDDSIQTFRQTGSVGALVLRKVRESAVRNRELLVTLSGIVSLLLLVMLVFSCCGTMLIGTVSITMTGTYLSDPKEIDAAELLFTELEMELQETIDNVETDYPGYRQYEYNIGEIGHNPFTLISYLSAKYTDFTLADVEEEIRELFTESYVLTVTQETVSEVEMESESESEADGSEMSNEESDTSSQRTENSSQEGQDNSVSSQVSYGSDATEQHDSTQRSDGTEQNNSTQESEEQTQDSAGTDAQESNSDTQQDATEQQEAVTRLQIVLEVTSLESTIAARMDEEQTEQYGLYMETAGGLQMFDSPLDLDWYRYISSFYGYRKNQETGVTELHRGLDLAVPAGTEVFAGNSGTVATGYDDHYGYYVSITDEKGHVTKYAHLESVDVSDRQSVTHGERIGKTGDSGSTTGSKLHIECMYGGEYYNPIFYFADGEGTLYGDTAGTSGTAGSLGVNVGDGTPPESYEDETVQRLFDEGERYLGMPYTFGGTPPESFDCSAFVCWVFTNSQVKSIPRTTAQALYEMSEPVSPGEARAGDLIFFTGTYNAGRPVTHVGLYCGNGVMLHCGSPIKYSSISSYWQSHFYAFGRIPLENP